MYKNGYLLFSVLLSVSVAYSCEGPKTEGPINQNKTLWEQHGISTKQLQEEGKIYLGEQAVTAFLNGQPVQLPEKVVYKIVRNVKFDEESLRLATNFICLVSAFSKQANYFNYYDKKRGLTPLACLVLRRRFLNCYISGTTGSPLLGMVQQLGGYLGILCCHKNASDFDKQELKKVLVTIARNPRAYRYAQTLGLYDQAIENLSRGSRL